MIVLASDTPGPPTARGSGAVILTSLLSYTAFHPYNTPEWNRSAELRVSVAVRSFQKGAYTLERLLPGFGQLAP